MISDFDRDLSALVSPAALDASRKLDDRLAVFDRVCVLAMRSGQRLNGAEIDIARRLILVGATNPEAVLADARGYEAVL